jgi:hypothetical protein
LKREHEFTIGEKTERMHRQNKVSCESSKVKEHGMFEELEKIRKPNMNNAR